jgi:hypothetical protein
MNQRSIAGLELVKSLVRYLGKEMEVSNDWEGKWARWKSHIRKNMILPWKPAMIETLDII